MACGADPQQTGVVRKWMFSVFVFFYVFGPFIYACVLTCWVNLSLQGYNWYSLNTEKETFKQHFPFGLYKATQLELPSISILSSSASAIRCAEFPVQHSWYDKGGLGQAGIAYRTYLFQDVPLVVTCTNAL